MFPNWFSLLGVLRTSTDCELQTAYASKVAAVDQDLDLDQQSAIDCRKELSIAYEMLSCDISRRLVHQFMSTTKMECCKPVSPAAALSWKDMLTMVFQRLLYQMEKKWTDTMEEQHVNALESGGQLQRARPIESVTECIAMIRYNCAFNAWTILGLPHTEIPTAQCVQQAFDELERFLDEQPDEVKNHMTCEVIAKWKECALFAYRLLQSDRHKVELYYEWIQNGYIDQGDGRLLLVTKSNIERSLQIEL
jgi:hypothetical protein